MKSFIRISALLWADILVAYALFVMQTYLTDVWKLSFTHAAGILNFWGGISMILPLFFVFLVDALIGNLTMVLISSIAYTLGIGFVAMSTPPVLANSTGTCKEYEPECIGDPQRALFYTGMVLIAVGMAGHNLSVRALLDEQEDRPSDESGCELLKVISFIFVAFVPVIGAIALPYIKPWSLQFGIPAICTAFSTLLFLTGLHTYNSGELQGSPITSMCRVFVAATLNRSRSFPLDSNQLYKENERESYTRTRFLRCLERAAIILPEASEEDQVKKWRLSSVAEVEDAKIAVRMVPMWLTFIMCGVVSSIANTYFVEQANHMNPKIGKWKVPTQILLLLFKSGQSTFGAAAFVLLKISKRYAPSVGIGVAMVFSVLCCITAARIEKKRLNVIRRHDLLDKPDEDIPMSVYWLLFQFFLLSGLDSFLEKSVAEFYNNQSPKSMQKYLGYFTKAVSGVGFMCSYLSVYVVGKISERGGKTNWFQFTLNRSRLDRYYWVLAALSSVNLIAFVFVAKCYSYQNPETMNEEGAETGGGGSDDQPSDQVVNAAVAVVKDTF